MATFADSRATAFAGYVAADHDAWGTVAKDHGRVETRRYRMIGDPATIARRNQGDAWAERRAIGLAERERRASAAAFGHALGSHWGIEPRVQGVPNFALLEDERRVRVGDGGPPLAALRHFVRKLLRQERTAKGSTRTKRFRAALDESPRPPSSPVSATNMPLPC